MDWEALGEQAADAGGLLTGGPRDSFWARRVQPHLRGVDAVTGAVTKPSGFNSRTNHGFLEPSRGPQRGGRHIEPSEGTVSDPTADRGLPQRNVAGVPRRRRLVAASVGGRERRGPAGGQRRTPPTAPNDRGQSFEV